MKTNQQRIRMVGALLAGVWLMAGMVSAAVTNTVPWADSFEPYTNGFQVNGTNGWMADVATAATVSTNTSVLQALWDYHGGGKSYPLESESHTNVLRVTDLVLNNTRGATGGVVVVDFLVMPVFQDCNPVLDSGLQYAFYVSTNGHVVIWHRNTTVSPSTNEWRELNNAPLSSNQWTRFTVRQDYSNSLFEIRLNNGTPLTDSAGWMADGNTTGGSWFHMVQTNGVMSRFRMGDTGPSYVEDVAVTNRHVAWTGGSFEERILNDGMIDPVTTLVLTLTHDTFTGLVGDDFVANGKVVVSGLPSNLVAVARRDSDTQLTVTLTNAALAHESINSISNLALQLTDDAFAMGQARDVASYTNGALSITFHDTPSLSYTGSGFTESGANDGSIDTNTPFFVTLTNGVFSGTNGEDFAANSNKLVVSGLPAGLTASVVRVSSSQLRITLVGHALQSAASNSVAALAFTFGGDAFSLPAGTLVLHLAVDLSLTFVDPSVVNYGATVFAESVTNDGTIATAAAITLDNKRFNASAGDDLALAGAVTSPNLPQGLHLSVVCVDDTHAVMRLTGSALAHAASNSVAGVSVTFGDAAFVGGTASTVVNASVSDLHVQFFDPRILTYSRTVFTELSAGMIDNRNPVTIRLSGDTFAGGAGEDFVATHRLVVSPALPFGLTAEVTRDNATQLTVRITGSAFNNSTNDSVSNVGFTFQDDAFAGQYALFVGNYQMTGIRIDFVQDAGFFNIIPFADSFERYTRGMGLPGTNGWNGDVPDAAYVTNAPGSASLADYLHTHLRYPIVTTHTQEVYQQDNVSCEIHSETAPYAVVDFMALPTPVTELPDSDAGRQYAFCVNTNGQLVIWHQNRSAAPVNEWRPLTLAPQVSTSTWSRFSIETDYVRNRFQIRVNESAPFTDAAGWSEDGLSQPGSWFYMVQTNGYMTRIRMKGTSYFDDMTVKTTLDNELKGDITESCGLGKGAYPLL